MDQRQRPKKEPRRGRQRVLAISPSKPTHYVVEDAEIDLPEELELNDEEEDRDVQAVASPRKRRGPWLEREPKAPVGTTLKAVTLKERPRRAAVEVTRRGTPVFQEGVDVSWKFREKRGSKMRDLWARADRDRPVK